MVGDGRQRSHRRRGAVERHRQAVARRAARRARVARSVCLAADPQSRVLLLEAGGPDNWIWFHIPVGYLFAIGNPRSDWMFKTEPEPGLNGSSLSYPRGKVIGG